MTRRPTRREFGAGLALAGAMGMGLRPARAAAKEVKVAMIAPLSGPWARSGQLMRMGADMAIDEINKAGGVKALGGAKMVLVTADAGDTAEKAKSAAQRLLDQNPDLVGGTGAWLSTFTLAVTEVTERAKLPWLTLSYSDLITARGFKYVFQTSPTAGNQAAQTVPTALKLAQSATGKRPKTIGILQDNTAAPVSFAKPLVEGGGLKKLGLDLVVYQVFTPPLSDATPLVQKVRSAKPDFMLLLLSAIPDNKLVLEKLDEFGLAHGKIPLVGNGSPLGTPELKKAIGGELLDGLLFSVADWPFKGDEQIVAEFKKRTGEPWLTQDGLTGYGDMWVLKEAIEKAGAADRLKVGEVLHTADLSHGPAKLCYPGEIKFDAMGRRQNVPMIFAQWQGGEPVTVFPTDLALAKPHWSGAAG